MGSDAVKALVALARKLGWPVLPPFPAALVHRFTGFNQFLLDEATIKSALSDESVRVPYAEASGAIGLAQFPLALDGDDHGTARELISDVLVASGAAHAAGVAAAASAAATIIDEAGDRLDVVAQLVDPVLAKWVEIWFGLPGMGVDLQRAARLTMHTIFLNPKLPKGDRDDDAREVAADYLEGVRTQILDCPRNQDESMVSVVKALRGSPGVDDDLVATHLLGLTVGPLALGSQTLATAINTLLDWESPVAPITDVAHARRILEELMVASPPLPGVPRRVDRAIGKLPQGNVLALTGGVAQTDTSDDPAKWVFGAGSHACMGQKQITGVGAAILMALSRARPVRAPGPDGALRDGAGPSGVRDWPFPGHLTVALQHR